MSEPPSRRRLSAAEAKRLRVNLVRVAGLAAVLGLLMEAVLVLGGQATATLSSLLDNGLWPFMVCMAVAVGQSVAGGRPAQSGAFSLIATPVAFLVAKIIQKGMSVLLGGEASGGFVNGPLVLEAVLRGIEYAVLAAVLAWLVWRPWAGVLAHLGFAAAIGIVFGLIIALFLPPDSLLGWFVEELVFPTGCALIVFASETLVHLLPEEAALL